MTIYYVVTLGKNKESERHDGVPKESGVSPGKAHNPPREAPMRGSTGWAYPTAGVSMRVQLISKPGATALGSVEREKRIWLEPTTTFADAHGRARQAFHIGDLRLGGVATRATWEAPGAGVRTIHRNDTRTVIRA